MWRAANGQPPARRTAHGQRRALRAAVAIVAALLAGLAPASTAHASPSVSELESQIDQLWNQLEPVIEQYNGVHEQLQQNQAKQAALAKQLAPLHTQIDLAEVRVGAMAASLYKRGPGSNLNALLVSGSPEAFADQLAALNRLARDQQQTLAQVRTQVQQYDTQKQALDALVAQQKQQDADLAKHKKDIQGQINHLNQLRRQAMSAGAPTSGHGKNDAYCHQLSGSGSGYQAAKYACAQVGEPYDWGAAGPGSWDCSGLTMRAWGSVGVSLPHNAYQQKKTVKAIAASQLRIGDLIFYGSDVHHVALYLGNGWMVHAPREGEPVMVSGIRDPGSISGYGRPG